jgi:hypothetical protein
MASATSSLDGEREPTRSAPAFRAGWTTDDVINDVYAPPGAAARDVIGTTATETDHQDQAERRGGVSARSPFDAAAVPHPGRPGCSPPGHTARPAGRDGGGADREPAPHRSGGTPLLSRWC